ncbi:MAG: hypothetical protein WD646_05505 [Actinomycetota bacterium]
MSDNASILRGWARRYVGAAAVLLAAALLVSFLPSRVPDRIAEAAEPQAAGTAVVPLATPRSTVGPAQPSLPGSVIQAAPPEVEGEAPPEVSPDPDGPGTAPACPLELPATEPAPQGAPFIVQFLPLVGPFGPEALAFLPFLGSFLPIVTPFFPFAAPLEDSAEVSQLVNGAILIEQTVFGPLGPMIEEFHPQALETENQILAVLLPVADASAPVVTCLYQVNSLVASLLPKP